jgi:hypothetical protein
MTFREEQKWGAQLIHYQQTTGLEFLDAPECGMRPLAYQPVVGVCQSGQVFPELCGVVGILPIPLLNRKGNEVVKALIDQGVPLGIEVIGTDYKPLTGIEARIFRLS